MTQRKGVRGGTVVDPPFRKGPWGERQGPVAARQTHSSSPGDVGERGVGSYERFAPYLVESEEPGPWADVVQQQTRVAIAALSTTQHGYLTIRSPVLGDAALFAFDDGLLVHRFRDGRKWKYPDVEALLTDGWTID